MEVKTKMQTWAWNFIGVCIGIAIISIGLGTMRWLCTLNEPVFGEDEDEDIITEREDGK